MIKFEDQFGFFDPKQPYSVTYGRLPHWQQEGATYFITFRTIDSIPQEALELWQREHDDALFRLGTDVRIAGWQTSFSKLPWGVKRNFHREFATKLERNLDELHGECVLKLPELSLEIDQSLKKFDGERYHLGGFVVMPNHVHVLVCFKPGVDLLKQCYSWKHFTSRMINKKLSQSGHFWQSESFDHLVRDFEHFEKFRKYIANNPLNAKLREAEYRVHLPEL